MHAVLTADGGSLSPHLPSLLAECGVTDPAAQQRFLVAGCEALPGFEAVALGQKVDVAKVQPHMVKLVQERITQAPKIRAVLLECTELPPCARRTHVHVLPSRRITPRAHAASEAAYAASERTTSELTWPRPSVRERRC